MNTKRKIKFLILTVFGLLILSESIWASATVTGNRRRIRRLENRMTQVENELNNLPTPSNQVNQAVVNRLNP